MLQCCEAKGRMRQPPREGIDMSMCFGKEGCGKKTHFRASPLSNPFLLFLCLSLVDPLRRGTYFAEEQEMQYSPHKVQQFRGTYSIIIVVAPSWGTRIAAAGRQRGSEWAMSCKER